MSAHQMSVYQLAENLGMTVTRMKREMTLSEYFGWVTFYGERSKGEDAKPPQKGDGINLTGFDI